MGPPDLPWDKVGFLNINGEDNSRCRYACVWKMLQD
jgi:hypothetical protein